MWALPKIGMGPLSKANVERQCQEAVDPDGVGQVRSGSAGAIMAGAVGSYRTRQQAQLWDELRQLHDAAQIEESKGGGEVY